MATLTIVKVPLIVLCVIRRTIPFVIVEKSLVRFVVAAVPEVLVAAPVVDLAVVLPALLVVVPVPVLDVPAAAVPVPPAALPPGIALLPLTAVLPPAGNAPAIPVPLNELERERPTGINSVLVSPVAVSFEEL